jgi:hypothetical protein
MARAGWLRKVPIKQCLGSFRSSGFFLDEKSFQFASARERARVERNHSRLAVLTIELPSDRATVRNFNFLGRLLVRRLRITDTIGLLPERRVGVLLPDTSKSGAWKVADDICSAYPVGHDRPDCEVFVYPDEDSERHGGAAQRDEDLLESESPTSIVALMVQPTPAWKRTIGAIRDLMITSPLMFVYAAAIKFTSRARIDAELNPSALRDQLDIFN